MFTPSPGLWPSLIEDRQHRMRGAVRRSQHTAHAAHTGVRVRLGHLLISAGSTLSGDRVELPAHRPALPRSA
jgi:hypothetical protein